jgi:sugar lactone lactonase YvrE
VTTADLVTARRDELGEGPRWDTVRGELVSVDILPGLLHRQRWEGGALVGSGTTALPAPLGCVAPADDGGWVAVTGGGILRESRGWQPWTTLDDVVARRVRPNDGACGPDGDLIVGTMAWDASPGRGALWRVGGDGRARLLQKGCTIPNGMGWSPDGELLWWTDTAQGWIGAYRYADCDRRLPEPERRLPIIGGDPDGLCVDAEGCLWVALWGAGAVVRLTPEGREVQRVRVPTAQPTAPCLGGPGLTTLFVTSAWIGLERATDPLAGGVFAVEVDVPGVAPYSLRST